MSFKEIIQEQKQIQKNTNKTRSINEYEKQLLFEQVTKSSFLEFINKQIKLNGEFIWADLGSGNELAMREAKYQINNPKLITYSIDMLNINSLEEIIENIKIFNPFERVWSSEELNKKETKDVVKILLKSEYKPDKRIKENVTTVRTPQKADLITGVNSIYYTKQIYETVKNNVLNLKEKGILLFNILDFVYVVRPQDNLDKFKLIN